MFEIFGVGIGIVVVAYLICNLVYEFFNDYVFDTYRAYMSLKELKSYKDAIILSGGGASIKFDYEWGIIFTPLTYWYYIYLKIRSAMVDAQIRRDTKVVPPWRIKK